MLNILVHSKALLQSSSSLEIELSIKNKPPTVVGDSSMGQSDFFFFFSIAYSTRLK